MSHPAASGESHQPAELAPVAEQKSKYEVDNLPKPSDQRRVTTNHVVNVNDTVHLNVEYIKGETRTFNTYKQTLTVEPAQCIINPPIYVDMSSAKKAESK